MNVNTLVTGGNGFVARALIPALHQRVVRRALRESAVDSRPGDIVVGDIGPDTDWRAALEGADTVIHLAARTHVLRETVSDPLVAFRKTNVEGTRRLAEQAAVAGVRRLVFLSSVKVNGEKTTGRPYTEDDPAQPEDAYGLTKWEAEQALRAIERQFGLQVVILRPPLVYGPGVKGNFLRLLTLISRGWPLPLASVHNQRSMVYLGNLVDAIVTCLNAPAAAGHTYLVSDNADVSTPQLVRALALRVGVKPRLFPFPPSLLMLGATALGKSDEAARLLGSLQVSGARIHRELGWQPPYPVDKGLEETARWYLDSVNRQS